MLFYLLRYNDGILNLNLEILAFILVKLYSALKHVGLEELMQLRCWNLNVKLKK